MMIVVERIVNLEERQVDLDEDDEIRQEVEVRRDVEQAPELVD